MEGVISSVVQDLTGLLLFGIVVLVVYMKAYHKSWNDVWSTVRDYLG